MPDYKLYFSNRIMKYMYTVSTGISQRTKVGKRNILNELAGNWKDSCLKDELFQQLNRLYSIHVILYFLKLQREKIEYYL